MCKERPPFPGGGARNTATFRKAGATTRDRISGRLRVGPPGAYIPALEGNPPTLEYPLSLDRGL